MVKQIHENIEPQSRSTLLEAIVIESAEIDNAVLRRLIEEIEEIDFESGNHINAYNRTHNRHNRGR